MSTDMDGVVIQIPCWKLPKQTSSIAPPEIWTNADQDPVPREQQTWTGLAFVMYWFSDLVTVSGWSAPASILTVGLSSTDAILITLCAAICNAIPTVMNGAIGANLHIPFPIAIRASYGYWFSYFCVVSRGILALFWFGVQGAFGADCITPIICSIWPSYAYLPNHLPTSAGITTQGMISYLLYQILQFPFLLIPTERLKYMFMIKAIVVPPTALAMVIYVSVKAGGGSDLFGQPATVHGSKRAWLWLANLTSVTGGFSTLAVNISDFSRFAKSPGAQVWQLPCIPFFKVIVGVFGVVAAGASTKVYGETLWSPIDIINEWNGTPGGRAAMFFCGLVWLLAQFCVNISANSVSFANDVTTLAPKWFNIRRGVILASVLGGWALCPWIIVASADTFLNFMSGYAIFMAPIAGILMSDYWIVKKRDYDVPALYDPKGIYKYNKFGCNWRALVTTLIVIVPLLPGLASAVSPSTVQISEGLKHLYDFNWLYGFLLSIFLYVGLNWGFPEPSTTADRVIYGVPEAVSGDDDLERQGNFSGKEKMFQDTLTGTHVGAA
ncbi:putative ncs1 allantoate transporter [Phaeomoniella chlamydospora]|uniref:Putative ncs1 allantoate transporter n=1 Tax=Phaeomoniella chlamydospora TaxID=158046 RepID=A0A0G2DZ03_PHACM|nr:putative ncs1 allantoate transporter [Phaeomoniella chlamydospora]